MVDDVRKAEALRAFFSGDPNVKLTIKPAKRAKRAAIRVNRPKERKNIWASESPEVQTSYSLPIPTGNFATTYSVEDAKRGVPYPAPDAGTKTTSPASLNAAINALSRITGQEDEGSLREPQQENLKWRGKPVSPEVAAVFDALLKAELLGRSKAAPNPKPRAVRARPAAAPVEFPAPAPLSKAALKKALAFAERLKQAENQDARRAALDAYYAARKKNTWVMAKEKAKADAEAEGTSKRPTPEQFYAWLNTAFRDRCEVGMVLSDMFHLDKPAYDKVIEWSRKDSDVPRETIDTFGLPTKIIKHDDVQDDPTAIVLTAVAEFLANPTRDACDVKTLHAATASALYHLGRD